MLSPLPLALAIPVITRQLSPRSVDRKTLASFSFALELEPVLEEVVEIEQAELKKTTPTNKNPNFKFFNFLI